MFPLPQLYPFLPPELGGDLLPSQEEKPQSPRPSFLPQCSHLPGLCLLQSDPGSPAVLGALLSHIYLPRITPNLAGSNL